MSLQAEATCTMQRPPDDISTTLTSVNWRMRVKMSGQTMYSKDHCTLEILKHLAEVTHVYLLQRTFSTLLSI